MTMLGVVMQHGRAAPCVGVTSVMGQRCF